MYVAVAFMTFFGSVQCDILQECAKLYNPSNYLAHLPSLKLPYWGDIPIPVNTPVSIKPSPVITTKAINVVTKYVYRNPVCVKYSKGKSVCKMEGGVKKDGFDKLVTKEYFVKDKGAYVNTSNGARDYEKHDDDDDKGDYSEVRNIDSSIIQLSEDKSITEVVSLKSSENSRPFSKQIRKTPELSKKQIQEMLIEDRLNQLETILPHYTRRRVFETSTITVTKVLSNRKTMATLVVKNCIPSGYELCQSKNRNRKSKIAKRTDNKREMHYFG